MFGNNLLHDEWTRRTEYAEPLVANALENWTEVDWFVHRYLASKETSTAPQETLSAFADDDPLRSLLADMKEQDHRRYRRELDLLSNSGNYGQGNASDAAVPATVGRRAHVQYRIPTTTASILGLTAAALVVMAAVWLRLRPSLTLPEFQPLPFPVSSCRYQVHLSRLALAAVDDDNSRVSVSSGILSFNSCIFACMVWIWASIFVRRPSLSSSSSIRA